MTVLIVLITAINFNTKAQKNLLAEAGSEYVLTGYNNYPAGAFTSTLNQLGKDSPASLKDHAYYSLKSKNYRTAGFILLGSGVLLSVGGLLISTSNNSGFDNTQTGVTIMGVGALAGIVSIPMMIIAHSYRNKASLSVSNQKTARGIPVITGREITGLTYSITIGK